MVHAGVRDVWVSLEYQVASIDEYLSGGRPWDLDSSRGGFRRMVPQTGSGPATEDKFAHGNGDLLLRLARDLEAYGAETLVVLSADHVFSVDLDPVIADHLESGLAATVLTADVTKREAAPNVAVLADEDGLVTGLEEKAAEPVDRAPSRPRSSSTSSSRCSRRCASSAPSCPRTPRGTTAASATSASTCCPRLVERRQVRAVPMTGYWRDLGRPGAYLQGHRDLLAGKVDALDQPGRPVISKWQDRTAARVRPGAVVEDSLLAPGCDVAGRVVDSVLGPGVVVEAGARVEDSRALRGRRVERNARVHTSVVDERCVIGRDAIVGAAPGGRVARDEDVALVGRDSTIGDGRRHRRPGPAGARHHRLTPADARQRLRSAEVVAGQVDQKV